MTIFLRLLAESDKATTLAETGARVRQGMDEPRCFEVAPGAFDAVPGKPFAYWVSPGVRSTFERMPMVNHKGRNAYLGGSTKNDFRFLRLVWEPDNAKWRLFAKGGAYSPFYADIHLLVNWANQAQEIEAELLLKYPYLGDSADFVLHRNHPYYRPGLTWPLRTQGGLSFRAMSAGCIFGHKGPAAFVADDDPEELLALLALANSRAFGLLVSLQMAFGSYEVGVIQRTPVPNLSPGQRATLAGLARRAWSLKRSLDTTTETSHAFLLPLTLRQAQGERLGEFDPPAMRVELARIQAEIDVIAFDLYGFSEADREAAIGSSDTVNRETDEADDDGDEDADEVTAPPPDTLLSWAIGVAFGRFDWRLATGERAAPPEPEPFDPLPAKSPGMLPDGDPPFHTHGGILVDDPGHPHDLPRIAELVLERVDMPVPGDLRRWVQKDFFPFHLQRYSKSRRKAPIYWPLATVSGSYALWLYYPSLTSQTLYTAVNDFVEPKLKQMTDEASLLRAQGSGRSHADEKRLEALESLETELRDLRDQMLTIAPRYQPDHDDGVQITAAPLWPLFRHKPWQKVLKDTWANLEKGDYDWAHLAMAYWPDRVREKCKTDKSLAIAHGLEELHVESVARPRKAAGEAPV